MGVAESKSEDRSELKALNLQELQKAVAGNAAAFRCRRKLQPAGGDGDKVFPPTFKGAVYSIEQRRVPGRADAVTCVLLDSVQSQANRMELALQEALDAGKIRIPVLAVDFTEHNPTGDVEADKTAGRLIDAVGKVTSLQVPHRLADAILRDSQIDGKDFRKSAIGKPLNLVSQANATALFSLCPTALVFGMWDSTGPKGGLGPKFERAIVSEIEGIGAVYQNDFRARGVRRDPLEIRAAVKVMIATDKSWTVAEGAKAKNAKKPSGINHGNVTFESPNAGVTIEYAEQTTTLSLICLRRLRFPINGTSNSAVDVAARTVLAALGLCSATLAFEAGVGLRSRCILWPDDGMNWELLDRPGSKPRQFSLTGEGAITLLNESIKAARDANLPWHDVPVLLKPSPELLDLVRKSQSLAIEEGAASDGAEGS